MKSLSFGGFIGMKTIFDSLLVLTLLALIVPGTLIAQEAAPSGAQGDGRLRRASH